MAIRGSVMPKRMLGDGGCECTVMQVVPWESKGTDIADLTTGALDVGERGKLQFARGGQGESSVERPGPQQDASHLLNNRREWRFIQWLLALHHAGG